MVSFTTKGGFVVTYDETIVPGDLITAYHKGYWQVINVVKRGTRSAPLIEYKQVAKSNGTKGSGKVQSCDASYCLKLTVAEVQKLHQAELEASHNKFHALMEYARTTSGNPVPRKHVDPDFNPIEAVCKAAEGGNAAFEYFVEHGELPVKR